MKHHWLYQRVSPLWRRTSPSSCCSGTPLTNNVIRSICALQLCLTGLKRSFPVKIPITSSWSSALWCGNVIFSDVHQHKVKTVVFSGSVLPLAAAIGNHRITFWGLPSFESNLIFGQIQLLLPITEEWQSLQPRYRYHCTTLCLKIRWNMK